MLKKEEPEKREWKKVGGEGKKKIKGGGEIREKKYNYDLPDANELIVSIIAAVKT